MQLKYILVGQTPVACDDLREWAKQFENHEARIVKQHFFPDGTKVSTVFLALDHNFALDGPPLLFETMIFSHNKELDQQQDRCSTWLEAEEMHERAVERVIKKLANK